MGTIHPTAIIAPRARLGRDVTVGPFCVIEDEAEVGDYCRLAAHVIIKSHAIVGEGNDVYEGAVLGGRPQHLRAGKQVGQLKIGRGNVIRENVTLHRALPPEASTQIGDHNLIMANAHVAHDCRIGDHVVIANNVLLAGFVVVEDRAFLSGAVAVHQFCRIGRLAMVGGQAHVTQDVPPFVTVDGRTTLVVGLNLVGLRRAGLTDEVILQLKSAYRVIYRSGLKWEETLSRLRSQFPDGLAAEFHRFLRATKRGVLQERRAPRRATIPLALPRPADFESVARIRKAG